jgi:hypothetical protein
LANTELNIAIDVDKTVKRIIKKNLNTSFMKNAHNFVAFLVILLFVFFFARVYITKWSIIYFNFLQIMQKEKLNGFKKREKERERESKLMT